MEFNFYNPGKIDEKSIFEVTLAVRCGVKWLFFFDAESDSWDLLHGIRLKKESLEAACDKLLSSLRSHFYTVDRILPICPYSIEEKGSVRFGMLFFLNTNEGIIEKEMGFKLFDKLPSRLTRGMATRRLFTGIQGWLNMQSNPDELWDVYDADRNLTGRLHRRGDFLEEGDYHLVVHVWLLNSKGEFLLTKRAPNKGFPNTWETPGGAAQAGDDSLGAALREVWEETGLIAFPENAECIYSFRREDDFCDVWLIRQDFDLEDVVLLDGETVDTMYASSRKVIELYQSKKMISYAYLKEFLKNLNE